MHKSGKILVFIFRYKCLLTTEWKVETIKYVVQEYYFREDKNKLFK